VEFVHSVTASVTALDEVLPLDQKVAEQEPIGVNHLTYQLAKAEHLLEQRLDHALGEVGLTLRQFTVLAHIARAPGMSRADVARLLLTTPQAVGGLVQRLVTAGLIQRGASSPGLPIGLTLTPAGERALHRAAPIAREAEDSAIAAVAEDERRQVEQVLNLLIAELCR
jgi:DNA-binding MarR family transcriptional regulator